MLHMALAQRAWMEAGVCGPPGGSAAGPVEVESPLLSVIVTAPGADFFIPIVVK